MDTDFLNYLDDDTCLKIFELLDDLADLVRVSCVSRSWRRFAIKSSLCKHLSWKLWPQSTNFNRVLDLTTCATTSTKDECSPSLETDHRVYALFARGCTSFPLRRLIKDAISASSTDNYPRETVRKTLEPGNRFGEAASYWSSAGCRDPSSSEILIYKLDSNISVITEINIRPFEAHFQFGLPIYAAKFVRFRLGSLKNADIDSLLEPCKNLPDDNFSWTYTSPVFPMAKESVLQKFKLPEPVLVLGEHLQIELIGRVQRQWSDNLFYTCICYTEAIGRSLAPPFGMESEEGTDKFVLKVRSYRDPTVEETPRQHQLRIAAIALRDIMNT